MSKRRSGDSGGDPKRGGGRYEEGDRDDVSGDSYHHQQAAAGHEDNENPEVTDRADEYRGGEPPVAGEASGAPLRENGDAGEPADDHSRGGSPQHHQRREENGDMMDHHHHRGGRPAADHSPRYSSERRSERMSRSPGPRRNSGGGYGGADMDPEDRGRGRRRDSRSHSPGDGGSQSPRRQGRSPRTPRENSRPMRRGDSGSQDRGMDHRDQGPYTQVYVTNFPRTSRREDLERHFSRGCGGAEIREVVMKSRFAFIDFRRPEDAAMAVNELDKSEFEGRQLTVQQSYPDGSKRRKRITGPQSTDECWTCGKRGHWANDCDRRGGDRMGGGRGRRGDYGRRQRSNSRSRRSRSPPPVRGYGHHDDHRRRRSRSRSGEGRSRELREGRCFLCLEKGHIKRDCPEYRSRGGDHRPMHHRGAPRYDDHRDRYYPNRRGGGGMSPQHSRSRSPPPRYGGGYHHHNERRGGQMRGRMGSSPPPHQRGAGGGHGHSRSRSPPPQDTRSRGGYNSRERD